MSNWAYYNEFEPYAAQWLRNLMRAGLIMEGEVDQRSIVDIEPDQLIGFTRCHFFAGIGGWDYALQLARFPIDQPVWTGSCPCQPFSIAGEQKGTNDERHLWPHFYRLISYSDPPVIFGEQVASAAGREWLSDVRSDLEDLGNEVGCADLCAAGIGAPQVRQRLYWSALANSRSPRLSGLEQLRGRVRRTAEAPSTKCYNHWIPAWDALNADCKSVPHINGLPRPVGAVHALGNAIVPALAAEFVSAVMKL